MSSVNDKRTLYVGASSPDRVPAQDAASAASQPVSDTGGDTVQCEPCAYLHATSNCRWTGGERYRGHRPGCFRTVWRADRHQHAPRQRLTCVLHSFSSLTSTAKAHLMVPPLLLHAEKHRGFAFVQFEDKEDAADAMDNMNNAELYGRVSRTRLP